MLNSDVAIVGKGVLGSFAASACVAEGARVTVVDSCLPWNAQGSSVGASRRCNIPHASRELADVAERSRDIWREVRTALHEDSVDTGCLSLYGSDSQLRVLREQYLSVNADHEVFDTDQLRRRGFPITVREGDCAVYDPDAFLVRPESVLSLLTEQLRAADVELIPADVAQIHEVDGGVRVVMTDGSHIVASRVILTLGKWASNFCRQSLGIRLPVRVTREEVFWFDTKGHNAFQPDALPTIDDHRFGFYAFPEFPAASGVKIGRRGAGPSVSDINSDTPDPQREQSTLDYVRVVLPTLGAALGSKSCAYVVTEDGIPIVDRLEASPRITFFAGCNGSSFKLAPELGRMLAAVALDAECCSDPDLFSLKRFKA